MLAAGLAGFECGEIFDRVAGPALRPLAPHVPASSPTKWAHIAP